MSLPRLATIIACLAFALHCPAHAEGWFDAVPAEQPPPEPTPAAPPAPPPPKPAPKPKPRNAFGRIKKDSVVWIWRNNAWQQEP